MGLKIHAIIINMRQALLTVSHIVVANRAPIGPLRIGNGSMSITFLNPDPRLITWNPPESVKVGPSQFTKPPQPAGSIQNRRVRAADTGGRR